MLVEIDISAAERIATGFNHRRGRKVCSYSPAVPMSFSFWESVLLKPSAHEWKVTPKSSCGFPGDFCFSCGLLMLFGFFLFFCFCFLLLLPAPNCCFQLLCNRCSLPNAAPLPGPLCSTLHTIPLSPFPQNTSYVCLLWVNYCWRMLIVGYKLLLTVQGHLWISQVFLTTGNFSLPMNLQRV